MREVKNEHEIDYMFRNGFFHVLAINANGAVRVEGKTEQEAKSRARSEFKKIEWRYKAEEALLQE